MEFLMSNTKNRLSKVKNFAVYYGLNMLEQLSCFDLVIVEPSAYDQNLIESLKKNGTIVLAYLSVMEIHPDFPEFNLLNSNDFVSINGDFLINKPFGTYIININSGTWNRILMHKAGKFLIGNTFDGLFLDTLGDLEFDCYTDIVLNSLLAGAVNFLSILRSNYSNSIIVQNNGLDRLLPLSSDFIDGICWENPPVGMQKNKFIKPFIQRLQFIQKTKNIKVFITSEDNKDNTSACNINLIKKMSNDNEFLFYHAPHLYLNKVNVF